MSKDVVHIGYPTFKAVLGSFSNSQARMVLGADFSNEIIFAEFRFEMVKSDAQIYYVNLSEHHFPKKHVLSAPQYLTFLKSHPENR